MGLHSFHLVNLAPAVTARLLAHRSRWRSVAGLRHHEAMAMMELGAPVVSPARFRLRRFALFGAWRGPEDLDRFLDSDPLGRQLAGGWHVRMEFLRRWGHLTGVEGLPGRAGRSDPDEPVVAVTIARMRLARLPRFLHWGRPVERLVRDHPGTIFACAAMRPPRTVCTFSTWRSVRDMVEMVHGHSPVEQPRRHIDAMAERERRDFHHEFVTLRFRPLAEYGQWRGGPRLLPEAITHHRAPA